MALPKPSNALLKKCKTNKLKTPMHKAFCDLILAGWEKEDAYAFSGLWNPTYSTLMNIQDMNHLLKEDVGVVEYIDTRVKELEALKKKAKKAVEQTDKPDFSEIDMNAELSKEAQLKELLAAKALHPVGSKEWLDIKKMIADISRVKQDDIQDEDDVVHFYVPIQCHNCSLYMAQKSRDERK
jgi:hypothetical protein